MKILMTPPAPEAPPAGGEPRSGAEGASREAFTDELHCPHVHVDKFSLFSNFVVGGRSGLVLPRPSTTATELL